MANPATPPRRSVLGRLVGGLTHLIASPRHQAAPNNQVAQAAQPEALAPETPPAAGSGPLRVIDVPNTPPNWNPSMIKTKHISEMEDMWNEVIQPRPRQPQTPTQRARYPRSCPPKWRNTPANRAAAAAKKSRSVVKPRSAMKKRAERDDDVEGHATPTTAKRVKFNAHLQERFISPPFSDERERELVPEHRVGVNCSRGIKRSRATDPYTGQEFADSPNMFATDLPSKRARYEDDFTDDDAHHHTPPQRSSLETGDESTCCTDNTPTTQDNTDKNEGIGQPANEPFVPSRCHPTPGTWTLDYDAYGEDDDYSDMEDEELSELALLQQRKIEIQQKQRTKSRQGKEARQARKTEHTQQAVAMSHSEGHTGGQIDGIQTPPVAGTNWSKHDVSPKQREKSQPDRRSLEYSKGSDYVDDSSSIWSPSRDNTPNPKNKMHATNIFQQSGPSAPSPRSARGNIDSPPSFATSTSTVTTQLGQSGVNRERQSSDSPSDESPRTPPDSEFILPPNSAAIDAEMDALQWPPKITYVEAGIASQEVVDLLDENWDEEDEYYSNQWWNREFNRFKAVLSTAHEQGLEIEVEL